MGIKPNVATETGRSWRLRPPAPLWRQTAPNEREGLAGVLVSIEATHRLSSDERRDGAVKQVIRRFGLSRSKDLTRRLHGGLFLSQTSQLSRPSTYSLSSQNFKGCTSQLEAIFGETLLDEAGAARSECQTAIHAVFFHSLLSSRRMRLESGGHAEVDVASGRSKHNLSIHLPSCLRTYEYMPGVISNTCAVQTETEYVRTQHGHRCNCIWYGERIWGRIHGRRI